MHHSTIGKGSKGRGQVSLRNCAVGEARVTGPTLAFGAERQCPVDKAEGLKAALEESWEKMWQQ